MFNSLLQSGGGRRGDSTRSRPGSARKITSCSFSWKNTYITSCCTRRHLLLAQAGVTSPDPYDKGPKTVTSPWAQLLMHTTAWAAAVSKGGPHGSWNFKTTCPVPGVGLTPSHPSDRFGFVPVHVCDCTSPPQRV